MVPEDPARSFYVSGDNWLHYCLAARQRENPAPCNRFIKVLSATQIAPGVHAHSIIPVKGSRPVDNGNDGVVEYKSAHIDGVESELIVRSGHSTQVTPETIEEVRRILYKHAGIH